MSQIDEKREAEIRAEAEAKGYHVPPRVVPENDNGYLEILTQAVFQAGFSWEVVRNKWPNFQKAFDQFAIPTVAAYTFIDIDRLTEDAGIIRNGRKIEATITNAQTMQRIIDEYGSFVAYLRSMDDLPYEKRKKALIKQFKWLGDTGAFFFLWSVGEDVPEWEDR